MATNLTLTPPPPGLMRYWFGICKSDPDLPACAVVDNFYDYRILLAPNVVLLAVFACSLVGFAAVYAGTTRGRDKSYGVGFFVVMALGVLAEILGYSARVWSYTNQWLKTPFLMQICCLTVAPAFLAAGIYLCLRRIVHVFGPQNSRIPHEYYTRIFIPCDLISLILQATGGAITSAAAQYNEPTSDGDNIMIAGLAFQVFTMFCFIACALDFFWRVWKQSGSRDTASKADFVSVPDEHGARAKVRSSPRFRGFLAALALATLCVFWRCVYRVVELAQGWDGPLMARQDLFIGCEGVMIAVACLVLNVFHPALCFGEMLSDDGGGLGPRRGTKGRGRQPPDADRAAAADEGAICYSRGPGDFMLESQKQDGAHGSSVNDSDAPLDSKQHPSV
ncbi:hypothetical protein GGTG_04255 [Gaeumannomyces tritici R3-111a-1]|uniref:Parasitic phase-specific protein PSP-1 n=1 Tax=Gaeumannomyces tritici (strain R3-111a-1) TaxID=644352 RepID=J3NSK4_GAET3|nr:hypothetical protein GGTG_04255 [Gaeumannomyces tritici R3-111a-1]EJT79167.1 hypothetical protein GGTG_04255 [Gaeumannomyces tritici R3-111a-1]